MKRTHSVMVILSLFGGVLLCATSTSAENRRPPPRSEVVGWAADATLIILAEPRPQARRRTVDLVARRVPSGEIVGRMRVFPGPCARLIERRVAVAHGCALSDLRPRLPRRYRDASIHIAANERGRISNITLRADGSIVEHELPRLGLVIRGRTEGNDDRSFAVLEVTRIEGSSDDGRILDRRPVRPRARRRWTLLKAGDNRYIIIGQGILRRIGRRPPNRRIAPESNVARSRPQGG